MIFTRGLQVCLAAAPVDLRCGFDSLSARVQSVLQESASSSRIFVFTNKRHDRVRLLYFDGTGLWLMTKRLEKGTFAWPKVEPGQLKVTLRPEALEMLLAGIDLKGAKLRPWWEAPSSTDQHERRT